MSRGRLALSWTLIVALGTVGIIGMSAAMRLRADRVPQAACPPASEPPEPPVAAADLTENLAVTGLDEAALAERGIARERLGELEIETGCVVAADPLVDPERPAFARRASPGTYPVLLYRARERVALAELRLGEGEPRRWVLALLPGQGARAPKGDEVYGYPVDAGLGSFMDVTGQAAFLTREKRARNRLGLDRDDADADVLREPLERAGGTALLYEPLEDDTAAVAVFQSGWGDGVYPSFWGLDAEGRPLRLVTDFGVLERGDGREAPEPSEAPRTP